MNNESQEKCNVNSGLSDVQKNEFLKKKAFFEEFTAPQKEKKDWVKKEVQKIESRQQDNATKHFSK